MPPRWCIDKLASDADPIAGFSNASLKYVSYSEFATDLFDIDRLTFVAKARIARDYEQGLKTRERGDDVLDHPVGKIFLLGIAAHVLKWQHRDGRFVGKA